MTTKINKRGISLSQLITVMIIFNTLLVTLIINAI